MRWRYLGSLLAKLIQALILKLLWQMWNWTSCAGCQSCRRRRSTGIYCSWSGTFQSGWRCHRARCAAAGCFWTWPAALLTLSWSLGCCLFSLSCRKVCSRVCRWDSSHGPQVSLLMDGKCQFRSSHGGPWSLCTETVTCSIISFGFSILSSSYIHTPS